MASRCQRQVFVDEGFPYGCCALAPGHAGPCELLTVERADAEIRQRRATDLTAEQAEDAAFQRGRESVEHWKQFATPALTDEEREALGYAVVATRNEFMRNGAPGLKRALAVLDKLLGGAK